MFVSTLTADGKSPVQYCENLQPQFKYNDQENGKIFLSFFFSFVETTSNFKHSEEKDDGHS